MPQNRKEILKIEHAGKCLNVISPKHFYSAPTVKMGLGLFADVDLEPGDIWWIDSIDDQRFVRKTIPWEEHLLRDAKERRVDEIQCYVDPERKMLIVCAEPFCRVNHGRRGVHSNAETDSAGNSIISQFVPAGREIRIPYDYESVVSIIWKFPEFEQTISSEERLNDSILLSPVMNYPPALRFLDSLSP